jgi:hypothetical protein
VRIVMTSATRDGNFLRPNGLAQRRVQGGVLIELTAMMQEIRQSCGLAARKEHLRLCSSHRTAEGKWVRDRRSAKKHERARFGEPFRCESRGQFRITAASHLDAVMFHNRILTVCSAGETRVMCAVARVMSA